MINDRFAIVLVVLLTVTVITFFIISYDYAEKLDTYVMCEATLTKYTDTLQVVKAQPECIDWINAVNGYTGGK